MLQVCFKRRFFHTIWKNFRVMNFRSDFEAICGISGVDQGVKSFLINNPVTAAECMWCAAGMCV